MRRGLILEGNLIPSQKVNFLTTESSAIAPTRGRSDGGSSFGGTSPLLQKVKENPPSLREFPRKLAELWRVIRPCGNRLFAGESKFPEEPDRPAACLPPGRKAGQTAPPEGRVSKRPAIPVKTLAHEGLHIQRNPRPRFLESRRGKTSYCSQAPK